MNKLVNEAVREFLLKVTQAEKDLAGTLETLRAFRGDVLQAHENPAHYVVERKPVGANASDVVVAAREFARRVTAAYPVKSAILFGSHARGTHGADSDIDIAIILRGGEGDLVKTSLGMADIAFDLLMESNLCIQPLPIWESLWEHPDEYSNPRLLKNIRREGIAL